MGNEPEVKAASAADAFKIGSVKKFKGHEGEPCWQGTLKLGAKVVCEWSDDSWGGPMIIHWRPGSEAARKLFEAAAEADPAHAEAQYVSKTEMALSEMVSNHLEEKEMRDWCKKSVVLKTADCKEGEFVRLKGPFDEGNVKLVQAIEKRYPGAEIINRRFPDLCKAPEPAR